ncbi:MULTISPECIES: MOSC domain-containing protein [unclassified Luteococcus]|uniref:MOSC domain-containing protein n=1 Tax=unclassified Luteococcus TaxID=2639923 RepID=UPI00313C07F2
MRILSVNVGQPREDLGGYGIPTGHDKRPVGSIRVSDPGPRTPDGPRLSGVEGDFVGDRKHHGGTDKAVYAVGREDLDLWSRRLGRELSPGWMGENLTTVGWDVNASIVGECWAVGEALLQVSVPRIPCRTFQRVAERPGWIKEFTRAGGAGSYLRVLRPGRIEPGMPVARVEVPGHGVSIRELFWARTTRPELASRVLAAGELLAADVREKLAGRVTTDLS